ncbi:uncharacterized protein BKA78DRAFT_313954 [Phyllosticta capitalensis]|uniref:uncharacterized protein n=1 Tax=Phyllosticta capitalensis TaxID=121624 RepID=UPI00312D603E
MCVFVKQLTLQLAAGVAGLKFSFWAPSHSALPVDGLALVHVLLPTPSATNSKISYSGCSSGVLAVRAMLEGRKVGTTHGQVYLRVSRPALGDRVRRATPCTRGLRVSRG